MSLKAYVGIVNEGFDDFERGTRSLWEVTRVSTAPDPYSITSTSNNANYACYDNNGYNTDANTDNITSNHYNYNYNNTDQPGQMEQLTVENLRKLDRRTRPMMFPEAVVGGGPMDTITEETSSWSQESFVI